MLSDCSQLGYVCFWLYVGTLVGYVIGHFVCYPVLLTDYLMCIEMY